MFSRVGIVLRIVLMRLVIAVKVLLWTLPGAVLMGVGAGAMVATGADWPMLLYGLGFMLMLTLGVRASLHYVLSDMVLADAPKTGVFACIRTSIQLMRYNKMNYFRMRLSFIGWEIAAMIVVTLVGSLMPILGTVADLATRLMLTLYVSATEAVFYLCLTAPAPQRKADDAEAADEDMEDDEDDEELD